MYKVPLTTSPNQTFYSSVPVNGENRTFKIELRYNYEAEYWLMSMTDLVTGKKQFDNLPLLTSYNKFFNLLCQLEYKGIGICGVLPTASDFSKSMPDNENLGEAYILVWGDNE